MAPASGKNRAHNKNQVTLSSTIIIACALCCECQLNIRKYDDDDDDDDDDDNGDEDNEDYSKNVARRSQGRHSDNIRKNCNEA